MRYWTGWQASFDIKFHLGYLEYLLISVLLKHILNIVIPTKWTLPITQYANKNIACMFPVLDTNGNIE
jgi:hypothetical protein